MIQIKKYAELSEKVKDKLNFYIRNEFGHIPIVNETKWAIPDWTIINYSEDRIVTFYNIIEREITIDDIKFKAGGINNVITPADFRGKGYASKILQKTADFMFKDLNCDLGVLLCADDLVPFYKRLNWYKIECPVFFNQENGKNLWKANTMLLNKQTKLKPKVINLNGLPW